MKRIKLFCDGSVDPQKKIGYGAYLLIKDKNLDIKILKKRVVLKRFEDTSSTKLEIETFLWAILDINYTKGVIEVYTDCQNMINLLKRKDSLEALDYHARSGKLLKNSELYRRFFQTIDKYNCEFTKVKGHKKTNLKTGVDDIFNVVDKAARDALRKDRI